ncbi:anti-sigma B factor antagonist [Actinoplanes lutulentus]|uniref:Anti-sigma factor antagonist n=1 Tax=Actinoplanes lutulentus TaxID=1287878 RepID=A0A327ZGF6_9ACTN|nr:STAS domain-containing protein [Actinoplanes lutulentus]MBB2947903.1 anti-sigma B factor antagonist [Actinoplanes lutulentus]RAK40216.1 anti-sigma B factor antagonist [Actinoplanes lutulentus]
MTDEIVTSLDVVDGTATVSLQGEIDILTVEQLRVILGEAVASRPQEIVVDMAGVAFIDSTGLGALISGFQRARDKAIAFRLTRPSVNVRQILVLSGLLEVVQVTP